MLNAHVQENVYDLNLIPYRGATRVATSVSPSQKLPISVYSI